jgi:hypothetical protein
MAIIKFDIRHENGQRESASVEGERALVGSASHCDVRLPMETAAYEHLLIEVVGGTLRVEAKADHPPTTLNGMPLSAGVLGDGATLGIGRTRLLVSFVPEQEQGLKLVAKRKSNSAQLGLVALLAVAGVGVALLLMNDESPISPAPAEAPELFAAAAVECPRDKNADALAFAEEQNDMAVATHERVPFAAHEGVVAVGLYQTAAACFRAAGAGEREKEAEQAAASLKSELADDFRARRLRLSHVLAVEDYELARLDVSVLSAMTAGRSGRYVEWLKTVDKQLKAKEER